MPPSGVLQIIPELETGGAERTAVDVAIAAGKAGWSSHVASAGGRLVKELEAAGVPHHRMALATKNPAGIIANGWRLARLARRLGVNLLHVRSRAPGWSTLIASKLTGLPFIATYHGAYGQRSALKGYYNSVMARGAMVIANSAYIADLVRTRHGVEDDRLAIIHRGTDLRDFDPVSISEDRRKKIIEDWGLEASDAKLVLQMARLTPWKGQKVLIEALGRLKEAGRDDVIAIFAGDAQGRQTYVDELEAAIDEHGLAGRARLVGHCQDVAAAMAVADCVVVPSTEPEAFGRAAVEAQAMRRPVIVSRLGAVPETVLAPPAVSEAERTGWHVEARSAAAVADGLSAVFAMTDTELSGLAERARAHVLKNFSREKMTAETLSIYERIAGA